MSDRWSELRSLFEELVELDEADRAARLREIGQRDEQLRNRLERMLLADAAADTRIHQYAEAAARSILAEPGARSEADPLGLLGSMVGRYRINQLLGTGGMGVVYRATDERLGRVAALKFLPPVWSADRRAKDRFLNEARAASSLDHPNVCTIYEADESDNGTLYIAMACYEGETLRDRLERGPLAVDEALDLAKQTASGLAAAHARGLVHRDIKPANLMLTADGTLKILDFGIAKAGDVGLTVPGQRPGTAAYMAPEQARGEEVDGRADLWSLGLVLCEMLTGTRPKATQADGRRALQPSTSRPGVPSAIDTLTARMLEEGPDRRPARAEEVVAVLERIGSATTSGQSTGSAGTLRGHPARSAVVISAVALVLILGGGMLSLRVLRPDPLPGGASLREIEQLATEDRFVEAFELAKRAEQRRGGEALPDSLWFEVADWITVSSEPDGAQVSALRYDPERFEAGADGPWLTLGQTPVDSVRVPRGDYVLRVEREGFATVERAASGDLLRVMPAAARIPFRVIPPVEAEEIFDAELRFHVRLLPAEDVPDDMVFVPGGPYELVSPDVAGQSAELQDFFIDRFDVTNAQYTEFIQAGGYTDGEHWQDLAADNPDGLGTVVNGFADRTGLPGPRNWTGQRYPPGGEEHPVTGVTWHEASAYCRFHGRRLPTLFEWEKAARDGVISRFDGRVMPWGYHTHGASLRLRANFGGTGTEPVDAHPFGVSPFGAHGLAGNAKAWISNPTGRGRAVAGGSWEDPPYMFAQIGAIDPSFASPSIGFRCARLVEEADTSSKQGDGLLEIGRPPPVYEPVDEQTFEGLLSHYRYDRLRLEAEVLETVETTGWTREKVAFNGPTGPAGNRIIAYLYLPHAGRPPFQTLVLTPGAGVFLGNTVAFETEWMIEPLIRSGRAAFSVVMSGMTEREWGPDYQMPEPSSVAFRDLMVLNGTELRIGLDYLESRPEIDPAAVAYVGVSMGAGSRLPWAAVDERFSAVILLGGGIDERMQPTVPEASNINFAPYIRAPKLLLNGRNDEESQWETRALPLWNLLSEPKELMLIEGAGHLVPVEERIPAMAGWLDRTFGPVRY